MHVCVYIYIYIHNIHIIHPHPCSIYIRWKALGYIIVENVYKEPLGIILEIVHAQKLLISSMVMKDSELGAWKETEVRSTLRVQTTS